LVGSWGPAIVGHAHPAVVEAVQQAAADGLSFGACCEREAELAEIIAGALPSVDLLRFVNSGTEANELAVRMARAATSRRGVVVMEHSYHGNSTLINELSTLIQPRDLRPPHVAAVEPPNVFRGPFGVDHPDPAGAYADLVSHAIELLRQRGEGLAAFLCDGIFDSQGCLDAPAGYFAAVYELVRAAGGVCIADEVQVGFGRVGSHFWAFEPQGVVPDIVTLGKPIGNGHPLAAVVTTPEIAASFQTGMEYFNTFGGNPVQTATGLAVLREIQERNLCDQTAAVGDYLTGRLAELADRHGIVGNIRGRGMFLGVDVITDPTTKAIDAATARRIPDAMKQAGVLMGISGPYGNTLKVRPPLVFEHQHADVLIEALDVVLTGIAAS
ncbi:MAG: aminotransferase class III-fold pyridoxal phosphate-dependent enzyme, partial [Acidimicrobiales bacterium]